jgi:hypothetical protein
MIEGQRERPKLHIARLPGIPVLPLAATALQAARLKGAPAWDARIFGELERRLVEEFEFAPTAEAADVVICAHDASLHRQQCLRVASELRRLARPGFFYSESDDVRPTDPNLGIVFRSSVLGRRLEPHERVATGCVPDLTSERTADMSDWAPRGLRPTLGFIGHVAKGFGSIRYLQRGWQNYYGFTLRERVLRAFERDDGIACAFTRRGRNLGPPMSGIDGDLVRQSMRREYVDSVFSNLYALCVRGAGNWSYRFFEALSAGRIPVLIDTDCVLPLDTSLDWDTHVCRIPIDRIEEASRLLANYHEQHDEEQLRSKQRRNRALWRERLAPAAFFPRVLRELAGLDDGALGDTMTSQCAGSPDSSCSTARDPTKTSSPG